MTGSAPALAPACPTNADRNLAIDGSTSAHDYKWRTPQFVRRPLGHRGVREEKPLRVDLQQIVDPNAKPPPATALRAMPVSG